MQLSFPDLKFTEVRGVRGIYMNYFFIYSRCCVILDSKHLKIFQNRNFLIFYRILCLYICRASYKQWCRRMWQRQKCLQNILWVSLSLKEYFGLGLGPVTSSGQWAWGFNPGVTWQQEMMKPPPDWSSEDYVEQNTSLGCVGHVTSRGYKFLVWYATETWRLIVQLGLKAITEIK